MYKKMFDKFLSNSEQLNSAEKTTIISIFTMVILYGLIQAMFVVFFKMQNVPQMVFVNLTSIVICILNLYLLSDLKKLSVGLFLWVFNSCYYILATTYILGYNKHSSIFLPVLLLLIHIIFPKNRKYLVINTIMVFLTFFLNVYIKYKVQAPYYDSFNLLELLNTICALILAGLIIYLKYTVDKLIDNFNAKHVSGLEKAVGTLTTEANIDFLTGLWNRRYIESQFDLADFDDAFLIIADIDHFKLINDQYGHLCGDYILKEISLLLKSTFRNIDLVSRWGGEEFLILLKTSNKNVVFEKLERTRKTVEEKTFNYDGFDFNITVTFGYTAVEKNISMEKNIQKADTALYYGKNNGRNCVFCYNDIDSLV